MPCETIQSIPLDQITVAPQVRNPIDEESLHGLATSMREVSQLQPIRLRRSSNTLIIVDGERRYRAAKLLGWKQIASIIGEKELCPAEIIHQSLVLNCQRKGLTPMETAWAMVELMRATSWNAREVAAKLGFSDATVSRLLKLLELPKPIQEQVQAGAIAPATGYEIAKVTNPIKQAELAEEAANGRLTRDAASLKARQETNDEPPAERSTLSRARADLGEGRQVTLSGPNLTLDVFVACFENLLAQARRAQRKGMELKPFLKLLKDNGETQ